MAVAQVNGSDDSGALAYENKFGQFVSARRHKQVMAFHFNGGHVYAGSVP